VNFRVTLTASYAASEPPDGYPAGIHTAVHPKELFGRLIAWSEAQDRSIEDCTIENAGAIADGAAMLPIDEPLMVATVICRRRAVRMGRPR
jgi:hypothetical protein